MTTIHITDIEAAINHWRACAWAPDGVALAPELSALAEVYGQMVFARAEEIEVGSVDYFYFHGPGSGWR